MIKTFYADAVELFEQAACQKLYEDFVSATSSDSLFRVHHALQAVMGRDYYLWGEIHPGYFGARDDEIEPKALEFYEWALKSIEKKEGLIGILSSSLPKKPDQHSKNGFPAGYELPEDPYNLVKFGNFLEWAIAEKVPLASELQWALGIQQGKPSRPQYERAVLRATLRALWYYQPSAPINWLFEHDLTVLVTRGREYTVRVLGDKQREVSNQFRAIAQSVDVRDAAEKTKPRKVDRPVVPSALSFSLCPTPRDFCLFKAVCKGLFNAIFFLDPLVKSEELFRHPLVEIELSKAPKFLREMAFTWMNEVLEKFPLQMEEF